jgi:hypothetical protein
MLWLLNFNFEYIYFDKIRVETVLLRKITKTQKTKGEIFVI